MKTEEQKTKQIIRKSIVVTFPRADMSDKTNFQESEQMEDRKRKSVKSKNARRKKALRVEQLQPAGYYFSPCCSISGGSDMHFWSPICIPTADETNWTSQNPSCLSFWQHPEISILPRSATGTLAPCACPTGHVTWPRDSVLIPRENTKKTAIHFPGSKNKKEEKHKTIQV